MLGSAPTVRIPVFYGLLAAPLLNAVAAASPSPPPLHRRAPQVTEAPTPTITAVSSCHLEGTVQYCHAGTAEFRISGSATASSYTNCHGQNGATFCMAPTGEVQIVLAAETASDHTAAPTAAPSGSVGASLTAVSECHLHESSVHCMAGATEYVVHTTATATADIPPAFTGCHKHGAETVCAGPNGEEVEISLAVEDDDHAGEGSSGVRKCHVHAGVEHCTVDGVEEDIGCGKVERDYNIRLRVGLLFVMLVTSSLGVFSPILISSFVSPHHVVFTILRQFGTGIIISTAFIHLFTHATQMFNNECLGELAYESTASAILMAGIFISFLIEYLGIRLVQWHAAKVAAKSVETPNAEVKTPEVSTELVNISVLEAGVVFHSLLIGLTLVVSADAFFITLFIVIVFHQLFEGIALGTRIAALGRPRPAGSLPHGHSHGLGHHGHFHEPKQPSPSTLAEELVAASDHRADHRQQQSAKGVLVGDTASSNNSDHGVDTQAHTSAQAATTQSLVKAHVHHSGVSTVKKLLLATGFALVTPLGMGIGIGVLKTFNGNDPSTIIAIGTLDALSAGILVWVGVVEMWAHDWMLGGEMTEAGPMRTFLGMLALVAGLALMSALGYWA